MAQDLANAIATTPTPCDRTALTTCAHCPYFAPDQGIHGWCQAFDKSARPHHQKTKACEQEIEVLEHNGHIPKPATGEQQSQNERPVHGKESHKSPLTERDRHILAAILAWDSHYFVSAEEVQSVQQVGKTAWINLTRNRTMPIAASMLNSIQQPLNSEHCGLNSTDNNTICRASDPNSLDSDIEVDSDDSPNPSYRVWMSWHFLGSFHRSSVDGTWLTNPVYGRDYQRHATPEQALAAITTAWSHAQELRVADQAVSL